MEFCPVCNTSYNPVKKDSCSRCKYDFGIRRMIDNNIGDGEIADNVNNYIINRWPRIDKKAMGRRK